MAESRHITGPSSLRTSYKYRTSAAGKTTLIADTNSSVANPRNSSGASDGNCSVTSESCKLNLSQESGPTKETLVPSIEATIPTLRQLHALLEKSDRIEADEAFHLFKIRKAFSRDEISFIDTAEVLGIRNAIRAAQGFNLEYERPLEYIRRLIEQRKGDFMSKRNSNSESGQHQKLTCAKDSILWFSASFWRGSS